MSDAFTRMDSEIAAPAGAPDAVVRIPLGSPLEGTDHSRPRGFVAYLTTFAVSLLLTSVACSVAWMLFAPPEGQLERPSVVFPSIQTSALFPMLARGRERFFEALLIALVLGTLLLAPVVHRALRRVPPGVRRALLLASQVGLGAVALLALSHSARWTGHDMLGWGATRVIVGTALAAALAGGYWLVRSRYRDRRLPAAARRTLTGAFIVAMTAMWALYGTAIVATAASVKDTYDTGYVVNELLAPANSLHPLAGYAASYTNLLGYALIPFVRAGVDPANLAVAFITLGIAAVLGLTLLMFRRVGLSRLWATLALLLIAALTSVSQLVVDFPTPSGRILRFPDNMFTYPQIMPMRLLGPLLLGYLVVRGAGNPTRRAARSLGFAAGLIVCNNLDFGSAAALAAVTAAALWTPATPVVRRTIRTVVTRTVDIAVGALSAVLLVVGFIAIEAHRLPDLSAATLYMRIYTGSLIGLPLHDAWGFHIIVIGTFVIALLIGIAGWMSRSQDAGASRDRTHDAAVIVALVYFSLFGMATLVYYLNRPVIPTLIGGTFFPFAICLVLLGVAATRASRSSIRAVGVGGAVLAVVCCTAFAQVAFPPPLSAELTRLRDGRGGGAAALDTNDSSAPHADGMNAFIKAHEAPGRKVAIMTYWPNTLALNAGVVNVTPFSAMEPVTYTELDLLLARLQKSDHPDVFLDVAIPTYYREISQGISALGYGEVAEESGLILLRHA